MENIFFSSDSHLGHFNIIRYCNRVDHRGIQFQTAQHMDEVLIESWNSVVGQEDTVYHLGDFSFKDHEPYLSRLNGAKKILIVGNHDKHPRCSANGWNEIHNYLEIKLNGILITLCHYKMAVFNKSHSGQALQFYGHSHGKLPGNNQQIDVGVDSAFALGYGYAPLSLEQIQRELHKLPPFKQADYHNN